MNKKQIWRVLFIILAIVFIFITASIFVLFITHNCCEPSICVPCLSMAKIQEVMRQFENTLVISAMALLTLLLFQFTFDDLVKTQRSANLVLMKMRLNN
ncbi:MAG: hypothetical protein FWD05_05420 [Oscillospiraceae bacterium]|nr:hypothetical protein [Oscillospiraceae bacterium]